MTWPQLFMVNTHESPLIIGEVIVGGIVQGSNIVCLCSHVKAKVALPGHAHTCTHRAVQSLLVLFLQSSAQRIYPFVLFLPLLVGRMPHHSWPLHSAAGTPETSEKH